MCARARNWVGGYQAAMRGRKPKPSNIKLMEGNPGRRPLNDREPVPAGGIPDYPDWLDDRAKAEWFRITRVLLDMRLLTSADSTALAAYCTTYSRWVNAELHVQKFGTVVKTPKTDFPMKSPYLTIADQAMEAMRKFMVEFGLTPSSRSRIRVPDNADALDEFDRFMEAG